MSGTPGDKVQQLAEKAKAGEPLGEPWPAPIPISAAVIPPALFPIEVFPDWLQEYLLSISKSVNCPVDYPACFALGVASGAIGATLRLQLTPTWYERACLYLCVVAPKSSGKTPSFLAVTHPFTTAQQKVDKRTEEENMGLEQKKRKLPKTLYATDTTTEAIAPRLIDNPRGMLLMVDELSGWIGSFNQYKRGGNDRQFWLSNWSGSSISIIRRNPDAPIMRIKHPCVSIVGGVQPPVLAELAKSRDDGLIERLLLSCPKPNPPAPASRDGYTNADEWEKTCENLIERQMEEGDYGPRPKRLTLTQEGWEVFRDWTAAEHGDERMAGVRSKLNAYAARLALVIHSLRYPIGDGTVVPTEVDGETMTRGVTLAKYFLNHAEHVHGTQGQHPAAAGAQTILEWIRKRHGKPFTRRDAYRDLVRKFTKTEDLNCPLKLLVDHGFTRWIPGGRSDRWVFSVNPSVMTDNKAADA